MEDGRYSDGTSDRKWQLAAGEAAAAPGFTGSLREVATMTISTAQSVTRTQTLGRSITVARIPAASSGRARPEEHTGLSQADLANRAITWYAHFGSQLRAGYQLTLRSGETGKAHTLLPPTGSPAAAHHVRRLPGNGEARGTGKGGQTSPGCDFSDRLSPAHPLPPRCRLLTGPVTASAQPWLTVATSRGSPVAAPRGRGAQPMSRSGTGLAARQPAAAGRNGGLS
jgi:hypothetical protein